MSEIWQSLFSMPVFASFTGAGVWPVGAMSMVALPGFPVVVGGCVGRCPEKILVALVASQASL